MWASDALLERKANVIKEQYAKVDEHIARLKRGEMDPQPGCSPEETLENVVQKELSKIRDDAANACFKELSPYNAPLNMALCGSKGSNINIAQMIACVGQQVRLLQAYKTFKYSHMLPDFSEKIYFGKSAR